MKRFGSVILICLLPLILIGMSTDWMNQIRTPNNPSNVANILSKIADLNGRDNARTWMQSEVINQSWTTEWTGTFRSVYTYNSQGNMATVTYFLPETNTSGWSTFQRITYTYNEQNWMTMVYYESFSTGNWLPQYRLLVTYTGEFSAESVSQNWSTDTNSWTDTYKTFMTYNASHQLAESLMQSYQGENLVNVSKTIYTYENGHYTELLSQSWVNSVWVNGGRQLFTYNGNDEVLYYYQAWTNDAWQNTTKRTTSYISPSHPEVIIIYNWGADITDWQLSQQSLYMYDADNNYSIILSQNYTGGTWIDASRQLFSWSNITGNDEQISSAPVMSSSNYPNPFHQATSICFQLKKQASGNIEIYNIKGQKVKIIPFQFQSGSHELKWDGRDEMNRETSSGIYLYHVNVNHVPVIRKMVKLF